MPHPTGGEFFFRDNQSEPRKLVTGGRKREGGERTVIFNSEAGKKCRGILGRKG